MRRSTAHSNRPSLLAAVLVGAVLVGACRPGATPPPGYDGPIASIEARGVLSSLAGATFTDASGALGGGTWTIGTFAVIPNARTGKGPIVDITSGPRTDCLPMCTDGDVADLFQRVHGALPPNIGGVQSAAYVTVWK